MAKIYDNIESSNLFWWYYSLNFDMFNLKDYMIFSFRLTYDINKSRPLQNSLFKICSFHHIFVPL